MGAGGLCKPGTGRVMRFTAEKIKKTILIEKPIDIEKSICYTVLTTKGVSK
jgi:hypothetical protein